MFVFVCSLTLTTKTTTTTTIKTSRARAPPRAGCSLAETFATTTPTTPPEMPTSSTRTDSRRCLRKVECLSLRTLTDVLMLASATTANNGAPRARRATRARRAPRARRATRARHATRARTSTVSAIVTTDVQFTLSSLKPRLISRTPILSVETQVGAVHV